MSGTMRDAVVALEQTAAAVRRELSWARRERAIERRDTPEWRAEIEACRLPLRPLALTSVLRMPALAIPFTRLVPAEYWHGVRRGVVQLACLCGAKTMLEVTVPTACSGAECERWFLATGTTVRVAVFEADPDYEEGV